MSNINKPTTGQPVSTTDQVSTPAAGSPAISRTDQPQIAPLSPHKKPLLFRVVSLMTDTLNSLFRTKGTARYNMGREIEYANKAKALFYDNTDMNKKVTVFGTNKEVTMQAAILGLSAFQKPTADVLAYKLARIAADPQNAEFTDEHAKAIMQFYLQADRSGDFQFPASSNAKIAGGEFEKLREGLAFFESSDIITATGVALNAILTEKLTTPQMVALGLSRGTISKEAAVILFNLSEGIVTAIKVVAVVTAVIGVLAIFGVTFSNVYTIGIVAGLVGVIVGLYLLKGIYEAKSDGLLDTTGIMKANTLSKAEQKQAKKDYDAALKDAKDELNGKSFYKLRLHKMGYWMMMMKNAAVDELTRGGYLS